MFAFIFTFFIEKWLNWEVGEIKTWFSEVGEIKTCGLVKLVNNIKMCTCSNQERESTHLINVMCVHLSLFIFT